MPSEVRIRDFCLREHRFNPAIEEFIANFPTVNLQTSLKALY